MDLLQAFWLGLVQGLTEFLPVSSSGHLMVLQQIFGIKATSEAEAFIVLMHVGTLISVFIVFWRRIWNMILHPIKSELPLLVLATLPIVAVALISDHYSLFSEQFKVAYLGYAFLITTLILWLSDLVAGLSIETKKARWYNALVMGVMQGIAILPGISRSGATIAGGISTGLSRKRAADFAFLMSIPAILGAIVFDYEELMLLPGMVEGGSVLPLLVGLAASAVFGFIAIKFMLKIVRRVRLPWFGVYTGLLGALVLLDQYVFHYYFK